MISRPTLSRSHWLEYWLEFVYTECCHDVILDPPGTCPAIARFNDTTEFSLNGAELSLNSENSGNS